MLWSPCLEALKRPIRELPANSALPGRAGWLRFGFDPELVKNFEDVFFTVDSLLREDAGNFAVGFALGKPRGGGELDR